MCVMLLKRKITEMKKKLETKVKEWQRSKRRRENSFKVFNSKYIKNFILSK